MVLMGKICRAEFAFVASIATKAAVQRGLFAQRSVARFLRRGAQATQAAIFAGAIQCHCSAQ